jgi:putative cell wall-binding protein
VARRRFVAICCVVVLSGLLCAPDASATTKIELAGDDRYETAVEISQTLYPGWDGPEWVVLATGENWPDALGGAALAGVFDGPILLTRKSSLPQVVLDELLRLGPTYLWVIGGPGAVSLDVEQTLEDEGFTVNRAYGADRYETALEVASNATVYQSAYDGVAFVTTGANFPDALAAGPLSTYKKWPLYLVRPGALPPISDMQDHGVADVIILGGTGVVSEKQEDQLKAAFGVSHVDRLAGGNRYETAAVIAEEAVSAYNLNWNLVSIATGQTFPDALAGGPFAANKYSVILTTPTNSLHTAPAAKLQTNKNDIGAMFYLGGPGAVSYDTRIQIAQILP